MLPGNPELSDWQVFALIFHQSKCHPTELSGQGDKACVFEKPLARHDS